MVLTVFLVVVSLLPLIGIIITPIVVIIGSESERRHEKIVLQKSSELLELFYSLPDRKRNNRDLIINVLEMLIYGNAAKLLSSLETECSLDKNFYKIKYQAQKFKIYNLYSSLPSELKYDKDIVYKVVKYVKGTDLQKLISALPKEFKFDDKEIAVFIIANIDSSYMFYRSLPKKLRHNRDVVYEVLPKLKVSEAQKLISELPSTFSSDESMVGYIYHFTERLNISTQFQYYYSIPEKFRDYIENNRDIYRNNCYDRLTLQRKYCSDPKAVLDFLSFVGPHDASGLLDFYNSLPVITKTDSNIIHLMAKNMFSIEGISPNQISTIPEELLKSDRIVSEILGAFRKNNISDRNTINFWEYLPEISRFSERTVCRMFYILADYNNKLNFIDSLPEILQNNDVYFDIFKSRSKSLQEKIVDQEATGRYEQCFVPGSAGPFHDNEEVFSYGFDHWEERYVIDEEKYHYETINIFDDTRLINDFEKRAPGFDKKYIFSRLNAAGILTSPEEG